MSRNQLEFSIRKSTLLEKWLIEPTEIDKVFWNISQQTVKSIGWILTESERFLREVFQ